MKHLGNWILGAVTVVMGVAALFIAAHAGEGVPYYGGLAFSVFAFVFVYHLIRVSFDRHDG